MGMIGCMVLAPLLVASGGPAPARGTTAASPALFAFTRTAAAGNAGQGRLIQISRFDCVTPEEVTDENAFPWIKGISRWSGGGPSGATWNASELRCVVELQTDCARGQADIELRVAGAIVASKSATIHRAGTQQITFHLIARQWEKHFDQMSPVTKRFPYRTATFSASATASCSAPEAIGPSAGPRREFTDDQHFTAGFAKGE